MSIKITKAKLTKNNCLEVSYTDEEGNDVTLKGANPVHGDLKAALHALIPFLSDLTEQKEAGLYDWDKPDNESNADILKCLDVTGVSIGGQDAFQVCTLIGKRTLMTSKVLNLCAPGTGFDPDNEQYVRCEDLRDAVNSFLYEAELYVTENKWAVVQQEIKFEEGDDPFGGDAVPTEDVGKLDSVA